MEHRDGEDRVVEELFLGNDGRFGLLYEAHNKDRRSMCFLDSRTGRMYGVQGIRFEEQVWMVTTIRDGKELVRALEVLRDGGWVISLKGLALEGIPERFGLSVGRILEILRGTVV